MDERWEGDVQSGSWQGPVVWHGRCWWGPAARCCCHLWRLPSPPPPTCPPGPTALHCSTAVLQTQEEVGTLQQRLAEVQRTSDAASTRQTTEHLQGSSRLQEQNDQLRRELEAAEVRVRGPAGLGQARAGRTGRCT